MLLEDLRDPELRALLHAGWQRNPGYLTALIDLSQETGQISCAAPSKTLAQLLLDAAHGGLVRAAVDPTPSDTATVKTCWRLSSEAAHLDRPRVHRHQR